MGDVPPGKPGDPEFFRENTEVTGVPLWWNFLEIFPLGYQGKLFMGKCLTEALHYKLPQGCTRGSFWSLGAAGCYAQREPRSKALSSCNVSPALY